MSCPNTVIFISYNQAKTSIVSVSFLRFDANAKSRTILVYVDVIFTFLHFVLMSFLHFNSLLSKNAICIKA